MGRRWPCARPKPYEGGAARAVSAAPRRRADQSGGHPRVPLAPRSHMRCHQPDALPARRRRWRVLPCRRGRADAAWVLSPRRYSAPAFRRRSDAAVTESGALLYPVAGAQDRAHVPFRRISGVARGADGGARNAAPTSHPGEYPGSPAGQTAAPATLRGFVLRRLDGLIGVNPEIAALFARFGARPERIRTILPFAVQPPDRSLPLPERLAAFLSAHSPALVTVGLLEPEYDLPVQIDAMAGILERYPRAGLLIVGAGSG